VWDTSQVAHGGQPAVWKLQAQTGIFWVLNLVKMPEDILNWSSTQGLILTGGGELEKHSELGVDYVESDLPHFHKRERSSKKQFLAWLHENRRSFDIVGCWSRPMFAGGWRESSSVDTEAFNLQTPSIFIDLRIPKERPVLRLRNRGSLSFCSDADLRLLARQHCFAGYSLPVPDPDGGPLHFIRHHVIDWNYHAAFPRNRPNRWFITHDANQQKSGVASTFKEFSFVRDDNGLPVYYERWARHAGDGGGKKYLAARRQSGCPVEARRLGRALKPDALFAVVGNHFAVALDRPEPVLLPGEPGGGGPAHVDFALGQGGRSEALNYLSLEGMYGQLWAEQPAGGEGGTPGSQAPTWPIVKSMQPWKEGRPLFDEREQVQLVFGSGGMLQKFVWQGEEWDVLECSFSAAELNVIFPVAGSPSSRAKL